MDSHEDKTTMPVFDDAQERGSTLLIALLLTLGLTLFGMSVLQRSLIEDTVSLHNTASTQALLTADAAVELAIPWLSYDYLVDPNGWSNEYLFVPAPPGTWPAGLLQDDAAGSVTGVPDTFYYDLRDANSDGTADQVLPNSQPYQVPEGAPFALSDELLPMGGVQGRPEKPFGQHQPRRWKPRELSPRSDRAPRRRLIGGPCRPVRDVRRPVEGHARSGPGQQYP